MFWNRKIQWICFTTLIYSNSKRAARMAVLVMVNALWRTENIDAFVLKVGLAPIAQLRWRWAARITPITIMVCGRPFIYYIIFKVIVYVTIPWKIFSTFCFNFQIDGMTDCSDSECCTHPICTEHIMCLASNDPVEVLLRKQPPSVTASFYQRVKFLIEENSVQSYAHMDEYSERWVDPIELIRLKYY